MKKPKFPTAHTILFLIAGLVAALTWLVPAGQYDRLSYDQTANTFIRTSEGEATSLAATQETLDGLNIKIGLDKFTNGDIGKPISIPGTYKNLDPRPQGVMALFESPIKGILAASDIILLVLIIGALIGIVNFTGAFEAGIAWLAVKLRGKEYTLIIMVTTLVALGGTTFGLEEETIAFYPILIPIFLAAKYDAIVAVASIYVGSSLGTLASTTNPFSTIIASDAAGINWTVGLNDRLIMFVVGLIICIWYIIRYAQRVKKDPKRSVIHDQLEDIQKLFVNTTQEGNVPKLTTRLRLVLLVFSFCFVVMIYGVSQLDWWFVEMTTVFLIGAILIGLITRMNERLFVEKFIEGANTLLGVSFIIGIARGVTVLMDDGLISDTLLYYSSSLTDGMHKGLFINVMLYIYSGLTFFIPSSSGMAVLTMPVMSPLADGVGIGRELVVNAYLYGVGLFKIINPTGIILASLAIVNVGYDKWLKFVLPLVLMLCALAMVSLTVSVYL
ncbi:YfcC family protein [Spongiimicrobium sp. 3-5]|uniref:YfcC family protein n=1 Tax=Spongiimicrobium sp. 3-5 TaxID=3332596 RepID=UPI00398135C8